MSENELHLLDRSHVMYQGKSYAVASQSFRTTKLGDGSLEFSLQTVSSLDFGMRLLWKSKDPFLHDGPYIRRGLPRRNSIDLVKMTGRCRRWLSEWYDYTVLDSRRSAFSHDW